MKVKGTVLEGFMYGYIGDLEVFLLFELCFDLKSACLSNLTHSAELIEISPNKLMI